MPLSEISIAIYAGGIELGGSLGVSNASSQVPMAIQVKDM